MSYYATCRIDLTDLCCDCFDVFDLSRSLIELNLRNLLRLRPLKTHRLSFQLFANRRSSRLDIAVALPGPFNFGK